MCVCVFVFVFVSACVCLYVCVCLCSSMANVKTVKVTLRSFELVSGLRINFAKSKFGAVGQS